jgi:hypothetical protein
VTISKERRSCLDTADGTDEILDSEKDGSGSAAASGSNEKERQSAADFGVARFLQASRGDPKKSHGQAAKSSGSAEVPSGGYLQEKFHGKKAEYSVLHNFWTSVESAEMHVLRYLGFRIRVILPMGFIAAYLKILSIQADSEVRQLALILDGTECIFVLL